MSAAICPFCKALVDFSISDAHPNLPPGSGWDPDGRLQIATLHCNNQLCGMRFVGVIADQGKILQMWPEHATDKAFPDVPDHVGAAASEAHRCRSIGTLRASVLMARSVIEATAKAKGIDSGTLLAKIDEMFKRNIIREYVRDGAHEVRHLGNDMAHGDFIDPVDDADAELILALMDEVLEEVFQAPERVNRARATRQAKAQISTP